MPHIDQKDIKYIHIRHWDYWLLIWLKGLSGNLFLKDFDFIFIDIPDQEVATAGFESF